MMNVTGIITEYNPFHKGHAFHLENAKKDTNSTHIICIMSGNFMQRGTPSMIDKWNRAKMAVLNGVDLVIELPTFFSLSSAENFAFGAVNILNKTNIVNSLYFGSEHGNINDLKKISEILVDEPLTYKENLKKNLDLGLPFHKAREKSIINEFNDPNLEKILSNSNNILGIEYIKALKRLNSRITPVTLTRVGSNYNDKNLSSSFSSATSIREEFFKSNSIHSIENSLPIESFNVIKELKNSNYSFANEESIFEFLKYKLLVCNEDFSNLPDIGEGLENKILKEICTSNSFKDLIEKVKSKRYAYTRISRILCQIFISLNNYDLDKLKDDATYIRPLAFNLKGAELLKKIKKESDIEIYTKLPKKISNTSLNLDIAATKAYSLINKSIDPLSDYKTSPFIIK